MMKQRKRRDMDFITWVYLARTKDAIFKVRMKEMHKYNLSPTQISILNVLMALGDNVMPAEIARWTLREPHSISNLLQRMERNGFVRRTKDLHRRNLLRVTVTEKGQKAIEDSTGMECFQRVLSSLSIEELEKLRQTLVKLWDSALKELNINPRPIYPSVLE